MKDVTTPISKWPLVTTFSTLSHHDPYGSSIQELVAQVQYLQGALQTLHAEIAELRKELVTYEGEDW